jgi:hypothetical protein
MFLQSKKKSYVSGYVLIYSVLIVGIILVTISVIFNASLGEALTSRIQDEALKAQYAADTGERCILYYHKYENAFRKSAPNLATSFNCGITTKVEESTGAECNRSYKFKLEGFSNQACAYIEVNVTPHQSSQTRCKVEVITNGRNSCTNTGGNLIERTRITNF